MTCLRANLKFCIIPTSRCKKGFAEFHRNKSEIVKVTVVIHLLFVSLQPWVKWLWHSLSVLQKYFVSRDAKTFISKSVIKALLICCLFQRQPVQKKCSDLNKERDGLKNSICVMKQHESTQFWINYRHHKVLIRLMSVCKREVFLFTRITHIWRSLPSYIFSHYTLMRSCKVN